MAANVYEFVYQDIDDGNKEKVAVTVETEKELDAHFLAFKCSLYADKYGLGFVTCRKKPQQGVGD